MDQQNVTEAELRQFIERAEQLASEKDDISEKEKELFAEAKGRGYCVKTLKHVLSLRKLSEDQRNERDAIIEIYRTAVGV